MPSVTLIHQKVAVSGWATWEGGGDAGFGQGLRGLDVTGKMCEDAVDAEDRRVVAQHVALAAWQ